jgi:hypothetical protein
VTSDESADKTDDDEGGVVLCLAHTSYVRLYIIFGGGLCRVGGARTAAARPDDDAIADSRLVRTAAHAACVFFDDVC